MCNFSRFCCRLLTFFFKINVYKKKSGGQYQSVNPVVFRSVLTSVQIICNGYHNLSHWRSQNVVMVTDIQGGFLKQAIIIINCFPLHKGTSLKENNSLLEVAVFVLYEQSLVVVKYFFPH